MPRMGPAARSPPRPRRCSGSSLMDRHSNAPRKKVGITSVVGQIRRRPYYSRRCKKVTASNIESLPNEVLSKILVRLSAEEIWEKARFVCRNWYHIIHNDAFIDAHVRENSNWGILLTNLYRAERPLFLGVRQGRVGTSELYRSHYLQIPTSCNGLVLSIKIPKAYTVNIINLATKQALSLPPSIPAGEITHSTFSMAYAAASMEYKVVRTYATDGRHTFCHILTVGVGNKWRCVEVDNLSRAAKKLLIQDPLITEGFMHWTRKWHGTQVPTLNAETEVFTESNAPLNLHPEDDDEGFLGKNMFYLSTGRHLSLFFVRGDYAFEVWEMEAESGEWRMLLPNLDLSSHEELLGNIIEPLGWIKYPVLLALQICNLSYSYCIVYNLDTDEVKFIILPDSARYYKAVAHRNTLEWLS